MTEAAPRAVLFDAVGTLIELREPAGVIYARIARAYGVDVPAERLQEAFGRILRQAPPLVFPDAAREELPGLEREWWRQVVRGTFRAADGSARFRDFEAYFARLYDRFSGPECWRAREGAAELLGELRARGLRTGVVSNFDGRLPALLEGLGLAPLLDVVVLPSEAGAAKPDPRIFRHALARLGVEAAATLFVGDDPEQDLAAARAAGLRPVDVGGLATLRDLMRHVPAGAGSANPPSAVDRSSHEQDDPGAR